MWRTLGLIHAAHGSAKQGIVHMVGPETGRTQPGKFIVCGDSHTATHGAFGAIAFGIGTSEVEHVLPPKPSGKSNQRKCWLNSLEPHKRDLFKGLHPSFDSALWGCLWSWLCRRVSGRSN